MLRVACPGLDRFTAGQQGRGESVRSIPLEWVGGQRGMGEPLWGIRGAVSAEGT